MMKALIEFAKEAVDTRYVHLEVRSDNHTAIHLYESFGFKRHTVIPNMMYIKGEYFDIDLMILDLNK